MRYSNKYNIDETIAKAITSNVFYDEHDSDISISQLVQPPQKIALEREYDGDIVVDVSDCLWMLLGSAIHYVLEKVDNNRDTLKEQRLHTVVNGWKVSGKFDQLGLDKNHTLTDFKSTSVWSFIFRNKPEWEAQLNLYAELLRRNNYRVDRLAISAILVDMNKSKARNPSLPDLPFVRVPVALWAPSIAADFLEERVALHQAAREGHYLPCTPEERWEQPTKWAVMKPRRKSALRVWDDEDKAKLFAHGNQGSYIQVRPGKSTRCADGYCNAAPFCNQWTAIRPDIDIEGGEDSDNLG
jgi:hypothetical protein